jgi:hypothetical protein
MRHGRLVLAGLCAIAALVVAVPAVQAGPSEDYTAVRQDFLANQGRSLTPCRSSLTQLQSARSIAAQNPEDSYNGFPQAVDSEIARVNRGLCGKGRVLPAGTPSPGSKLSLSVAPKSVRRRHRATFTFTVTGRQGTKKIAVKGARVTFQGLRSTSDSRGRVKIAKLFRSAGTRTAGASYRGVKSATTTVRVRR